MGNDEIIRLRFPPEGDTGIVCGDSRKTKELAVPFADACQRFSGEKVRRDDRIDFMADKILIQAFGVQLVRRVDWRLAV